MICFIAVTGIFFMTCFSCYCEGHHCVTCNVYMLLL